MAYLVTLVSVPGSQVSEFRARTRQQFEPTRRAGCSHLLRHLGDAMHEVLAGGDDLREDLTHAWRPPRVHSPELVAPRLQALRAAWNAHIAQFPEEDNSWEATQLAPVFEILDWAQARGEAIVTWL